MKSLLQKIYCYGISVSQMTMDIQE